jgi:hypothetical protein
MEAIRRITYCFWFIGLTMSVSWGQDQVQQKLIQGKNYFWEAKFEESMASLIEVAESNTTNKEYLFEAYLYMGFVLMRQDADSSAVSAAFAQAIEIDPKGKVDESVIPPDLAEKFNNVRNQMVGCIYVISEPLGSEIMGLQGENLIFVETTPALICDLVTKGFQILLTKQGFEEQVVSIRFRAGKVDTVLVTLDPVITKASGGKKLWPWVAGGGIVVSTAAILLKSLSKGGGNGIEELPGPPDRPTP